MTDHRVYLHTFVRYNPAFDMSPAVFSIMNSRERILAAISHQETDRLPLDLGGTRQSGIAASTYHQLKELLGLQSPTRVFDFHQMLAEVEGEVRERLGVDVIGLYRPAVTFNIRCDHWRPWRLFDGTPVEVPADFQPVEEENGDLVICRDGRPIARMPKDGFYFDHLVVYPGGAHLPVEELDLPLMDAALCEHYRQQSQALYQNTDLAIVAAFGPPYELFFGMGTGGFSTWMIAMVQEPDYVHAMCEKLVDVWLQNLARFADAVESRVQIIQFADDFGTQHAPFISVKMFRELFLPHYKRGIDWIHQHTDMKVMLHSDGAIYPLIPSLIEMGIDILNPVQTTADGMDAIRLKCEFGDRLVFWGGSLNCQETLPFGTPEDVRREVTEHIRSFAPGGGYVFAPVHNIQAKVPPENVLAMFQAAREWRGMNR